MFMFVTIFFQTRLKLCLVQSVKSAGLDIFFNFSFKFAFLLVNNYAHELLWKSPISKLQIYIIVLYLLSSKTEIHLWIVFVLLTILSICPWTFHFCHKLLRQSAPSNCLVPFLHYLNLCTWVVSNYTQ